MLGELVRGIKKYSKPITSFIADGAKDLAGFKTTYNNSQRPSKKKFNRRKMLRGMSALSLGYLLGGCFRGSKPKYQRILDTIKSLGYEIDKDHSLKVSDKTIVFLQTLTSLGFNLTKEKGFFH